MRKPTRKSSILAPVQDDYRTPATVTEVCIYWNGDGYYVCPRCRITLEREFSAYCDRCGQCLDWSHYRTAKRIYAP